MKRLFLPLMLLLSCAVAQSADEIPQTTISLKTEQRPNLASLFCESPTIIHSLVEKYERIKDIKRSNSDYSRTFAEKGCNDLVAFEICRESDIIKNIKTLHKLGADLNTVNEAGKTALEVAIKIGSPAIIATLINLGADVTPLFKKGTFNEKIKSLSKFDTLSTAIAQLPREEQKAIAEKMEQYKKEKEEAKLKKQQEEEQKQKNNERENSEFEQKLKLSEAAVNLRAPTYY